MPVNGLHKVEQPRLFQLVSTRLTLYMMWLCVCVHSVHVEMNPAFLDRKGRTFTSNIALLVPAALQ